MKIKMYLLMKAAKFAQNHKIRSDTINFNELTEIIEFIDADGTVMASVDFNNQRGGKQLSK